MSGEYRDRIDIERDASTDDSTTLSYTTIVAKSVPCKIVVMSGEETYRGRQLESNVDFVVEARYSTSYSSITSVDRVTVKTGLFKDKTLNIAFMRVHQFQKGKPPIIELFCREAVT